MILKMWFYFATSYFLWDFVLANEVCHFWGAFQQILVCTGNLKCEWNYWIKVDKIKRSITIQDQSQKFWIICVLPTQLHSHFLKCYVSFLFSFLAMQTKFLALKESASQRERAVSSTSTAAMPPVLCVSWNEGEISHLMQLHVCISTPSFTVHLMYFHFINFPLFLQSVLLINTSAFLSCFACLHFIFHIIPVLSNPFFHFQSFFCTIHLAAPLHVKP